MAVLYLCRIVRKSVFTVSNQAQYKSGCTVTGDGQRFEISDLESIGVELPMHSEINGADQLRDYRCFPLFSHMQNQVFS